MLSHFYVFLVCEAAEIVEVKKPPAPGAVAAPGGDAAAAPAKAAPPVQSDDSKARHLQRADSLVSKPFSLTELCS